MYESLPDDKGDSRTLSKNIYPGGNVKELNSEILYVAPLRRAGNPQPFAAKQCVLFSA